MYFEIQKKIEAYDTIIIHRHENPDGDALGSQIGLAALLRENYPEKKIYIVGDMSRRFAFMEGSEMALITDEVYKDALAIVLDTSASHLISDKRYSLAKETVRIDHHLFCEKICDIELVDTSFESCAGLVADFARVTGLRQNTLSAKSLYTGMVTDSGRFRYDSTSAKTHAVASYLMQTPFSTGEIYRNLYSDDFSFIRLRAQFVLKIQFTEKNVAYIYTTKEEVASYGVDTFSISRGMVNTMGEIRGVEIWTNFTETDTGILCEIRSSKYNINPVAVKYGGGGHQKASGATLSSREEAMALLRDLENLMGE